MKRVAFRCIFALLVGSVILGVAGCGGSFPQAAFEASVASGPAPLNVTFTNKTDAAKYYSYIDYNWDFGDGTVKNNTNIAETVSHEYTRAGTYTVTLTGVQRSNPARTSRITADITVTHGAIKSVKITPEKVALNIGHTQTFSATAFDAYGNTIPEAAFTWSAGGTGTITRGGSLTAGTAAGTYQEGVAAIAELDNTSVRGTALVTVNPDPLHIAKLPSLEVAAGETKQLEAVALDKYGNRISDFEATWSVIDGRAGTITAGGLFTATKKAIVYDNAVKVEVKQRDITRQAQGAIEIVPAALAQIGIAPAEIKISTGVSQQVIAAAADKYGNRIGGVPFTWSVAVTAGTITEDGLFVAGNMHGYYKDAITVQAGAGDVTVSETADVTVEQDIIVFYTNAADDNYTGFHLYAMNFDGSERRRIAALRGAVLDTAAPSPDGSKVLYIDYFEETDNLYVVNVDGSGRALIKSGSIRHPAWSPDGTKIAYVSEDKNGTKKIWVMNIDGTSPVCLTNDVGDKDLPRWSPDGTQIVYVSDEDGYQNIYVMNADGSQPRRVTGDNYTNLYPQFSPDGKKILFISLRPVSLAFGIFTVNADGTDKRTVISSDDFNCMYPYWSPDGNKIIFWSNKPNENGELYTINRDGSGMTGITDNSAVEYSPVWLSRQGVWVDESSIVFPEAFE